MKKFLLLLTLFCALFSTAKATVVEIGDPAGANASNSTSLPFSSTFNYGWSQQIYTSEEIGMAGTINSLSLWIYSTSNISSFSVQIYMAEVDKESFESTSDWVVLSASDLVFTGALTNLPSSAADMAEVTLNLDAPFSYSGQGNLLIAVANNTGSWNGGLNFKVFGDTGDPYRALYKNQDASAMGPDAPAAGSRLAKRNVITFDITASGSGPTCDKPSSLTATEIGSKSVSLAWEGGSGTYDVGYKGPGEDNYTYYERSTTATSHTFSNLQPNTSYTFAVKSKCAEGESNPRTVAAKTAIAIPYEENFDALTAIPSDWKRYSGQYDDDNLTATRTSSTSAGTFSSSTTGVFESKHMYMSVSYTYKYWVELPSIEMEENAVLTFMMALSSSSSSHSPITAGAQPDDRFLVLASVDEGATWSPLRKWDNTPAAENVFDSIATEGEEVSIDLSAYAGQNVLLAFYTESTTSNKTNYLHIDDVVIDFGRSCNKPTGLAEVAGKATKTSVQIAWDEDANAASWKVQYVKNGESEWNTVDANENPFTIEGLEASTKYDVRVAALCDASGESSLTRYCKPITVKTAEGVPYHEGFAKSSIPSDWKRYDAKLSQVNEGAELASVTSGWSPVIKSNANANGIFPDSAYHLYMNIAGAECNKWIVSPAIEMDPGYELSFNLALTASDGGAVTAGEQDDDLFDVLVYADDEWNVAAEWSSLGSATYAYDQINASANGQIIKVNLSAYAGKTIQIAFYGESSVANTSNNLHISNVSIDLIPACAPALSLDLDNVGASSVTASWTSDAAGTWQYGYVANPDAEFAPQEADYLYSTEALAVDVKSLNPTTKYAFFVRRACEESHSDSIVRYFTTTQEPQALPYSNNFEEENGWLLINGECTNQWAWGEATSASGGSKALYISTDNGTTNTYAHSASMVYATKLFYFDEPGTYSVSYDWHGAGEGSYDYIRVALVSAETALEASTSILSGLNSTSLPKGWVALDGGSKLNLQSDWQHVSEEVAISEVGYKKVVIAWRNDTGGGTQDPAGAIDNFSISRMACPAPTGLDVSEISAEGALVVWNENTDHHPWVYACVEATEAEPAVEDMEAISLNSLQLTGLTEKTNYVFYLRMQCGEEYSESARIAFKTEAKPFAMPFVENFDDLTSGIPDFWDNNEGTTTTATSRWNYYATGYEGKAVRFNSFSNTSGNTNILATPKIVLSEPALLSFMWKNPTGGAAEILIENQNGERVSLKNSGLTALSSWEAFEINLNEYTNDTVRILFKGISNYGNGDAYLYLDNVKVEALPICAKPSALDTTAVTTNSIAIEWTPGSLEQYWFVQYKKASAEEWIYVPDSVKTPSYTIADLDASSVYNIRVASWCNPEDSTAITDYCAPITIATECETIAYLNENFEDENTLVCWNRITETVSSYTYPALVTDAELAASGSNYAYFLSNFEGSPVDQYLILPELNTLEGKRIKFNVRKEDATDENTYAIVGVMTDPADATTFQYLDSIPVNSTTYAPVSVPFTAYTGTGKYVAIVMQESRSSYATLLIDDVVIDDIPNCVEASGLAVDTIGATMAVLKWAPEESGAWTYAYALASAEEPADEAFVAISDTIVEINGLTDNAQYVFYLRHDCGNEVYSPSISVSFKTMQLPAELPYTNDFESDCDWQFINGGLTNAWVHDTAAHYGEGSARALYISNDGGKSHAYTNNSAALVYATRLFNFEAGNYQISYDWIASGESTWDYLRVALVPASVELTAGTSLPSGISATALPTDWIALDGGSKLNGVTAWQSYESGVIQVPAGLYNMVLLWRDDTSGGTNPPAAVDNIRISKITCMPPTQLDTIASGLTSNAIQVDWTAGGTESYWFVQYKKASDEEWIYVPDSVNAPSYTLIGLDAATVYDIRVAAWCDPNDSTSSSMFCAPISIATECEVITSFPWSENFDGINVASAYTPSARTLPICWSAFNTTTNSSYKNYPTVYYYSSTDYSNSAPNSLRFYSYNSSPEDQYAILPEMEGISALRIRLNARAYNTGASYDASFAIGVMTNPADTSTFVFVDSVKPSATSYAPFEVRFNEYQGAGTFIAIKMDKANSTKTNHAFYIDDIVVDSIPNCNEASGLAVDTIGAEMAVLKWANEESGAWKYAYALASADEPADDAFIAISDTIVEVNGLMDNKLYKFYLRRDCGNSTSSSISILFQTKQLPVAVGNGFADDFEGENNWCFINGTIANAWTVDTAAHNGEGSTRALYISNDGGKTNAYSNGAAMVYAMKAFTFEKGVYNFQYDWKAKGESTWDFLRVALVPNSVALSAGTTLPTGFSASAMPSTWKALDGGSKLNLVESWQTFASEEIEVAAGTYNVVFAWRNDGSTNNQTPAAVDNFIISKVTCVRASALACASKTAHTASMEWKAGQEGQTSWQFAVDTISNFNPDTLSTKFVVEADSAYVLSGLMTNKYYYAYVRAICDVADTSAWSNKASFKTMVGNQVPTNVAVENSTLASDSAKIYWTGVASNDLHESFDVYYSLFGSMPEELNPDSLILGIQDTSLVLKPLLSDTTYYVWVRDNCGEDGYSAWTNSFSFKTLSNCPVPGDLSISNIEGHTADLAWAIGTNESYNVRYRTSAEPRVIFTEDFESGIGSWTMNNCETGTGINSSAKHSGSNGFSFHWSTTPPQYLISPEISGAIEGATLEFWYKNYYASNPETFQIGLSATDNAIASFEFGAELTASDTQWHLYSATIPAGTKYICFKYNSYDKFYLYLDDIQVSVPQEAGEWLSISNIAAKNVQLIGMEPETKYEAQVQGVCGENETEWSELINFTTIEACVAPSDLTVSEIGMHSATLSWQSKASAWEICLNNDLENLIAVSVLDTPYVLNNLKGDSLYTVKVRAYCGEEDGNSEWSAAQNFTTLVSCEVPTGLKISEISAHGAKLDWISTASAWEICVNGDLANLIQVEGDTTYTFTGLNAGTAYDVKVRAVCAEGDESRWSAIKSFNTECENISVFPWSENFNRLKASAGIPLCWDNSAGTTTSASYKWSYFANTTDTCLRFNSYSNSNGNTNILATPTFELSAGLELAFDWKNPTGGAGEVLISTDGGVTKTSLYTDLRGIAEWEEVEIDLSAYAGETVIIYFMGTSNYGNGDAYLYLDNVTIKPLPTCIKPTELSVLDVKAHKAVLGWKAGAEETAWQIAIDTVDFKPDTLSAEKLAEILIDNVIDTPYVVTGLDTVTTYYVYVRANCGNEDVSKWSKRQSFTTTIACPAPTAFAAQVTPGEGSKATLTWKAGAEETAWIVEYSLNADLSDSIEVVVYDTIANLTGLTAESTYYARVKADCGELDGESVYSAIISFTPTDKYELLLNNGTSTNSFVPIEGSYASESTRSQFIIPEADLAEIEWDSITSLTFYASQANISWGSAEWAVYMMEAPEATMSVLVDWNAMTQVKAAGSLSVVENKMVVTLDEPYQYQGGNLMIGIYQTTNGDWANVSWLGVSATGASFGGHAASVLQRNFLPKMLVTYLPGVAPACPNPKQLAVSDITDSEATFSWKAFAGANWEYALVEGAVAPESFEQTDLNSITIDELAEATQYTFYLRRACGDDGNSEIISVSFTTDVHVATIPFDDDFEGANYWKFVADGQVNAWMVGEAVTNGGDKAMYVSNDGENYAYNSVVETATFATVLLNFDEVGDYTINYSWMAEGDYDDSDELELYDYMRVALVPAATAITGGMAELPANAIALDQDVVEQGVAALYGSDTWQHVRKLFQIAVAGDYKLVVAWFNDDADGEIPGAIDNIHILKGKDATGIDGNAGFENKAVKFIQNDHVYILINGVIYDATGRKVGVK